MNVGFPQQGVRPSARLAGIGQARAGRVVPASELVARFGKTAEWLRIRTGIVQVRRLAAEESLLELAQRAAHQALADADVPSAAVDVVIVASCSADAGPQGPLSRLVADTVAPRAASLDMNAACAGFCYALSAADALIRTGAAEVVLVIGAEQMSRMIDPADLGTSILFGDGAGAAVVTAAPNDGPGIGPPAWSSDGALADVLEIPPGETALRMRGPEVFRWAVDEVHDVAASAMAKAGVRAEDIDVFVPHQANLRIVEAIGRKLDLGHATTAVDVVEAGNTSAASIPLALARLRRSGAVGRGQLALLAGFGAGLTIAAQVVRLP